MDTQTLANRLVELCRKGEFNTCYKELFNPNFKSIEADGSVCTGMEEIGKKGAEWNAGIEAFHGSSVSEPIVAGNHFSLTMSMDLQYKGDSHVSKFEEICVYEVKDGKIVKEQFFYEQAN